MPLNDFGVDHLLLATLDPNVPTPIGATVLIGRRLPPHRASAVPTAHDTGEEIGSSLRGFPLPTLSELRLDVLLAQA